MALKLGVTGFPLTYTRSPGLHRSFLKKARVSGSYGVYPFDPGAGRRAFFEFLDGLAREGFRGVNVTIPHKEWAYEYAMKRGGAHKSLAGRCATLVKAANTILFEPRKRGARCANTDAAGFWDEIEDWLGGLAGPSRNADVDVGIDGGIDVLVVGTGGAARGVIAGVLAGHATARAARGFAVWGRDRDKAARLAKPLGARRKRFGQASRVLIVWCLSPVGSDEARSVWASLERRIDGRETWLYDLNYGPRADGTIGLVPRARRRAGLGMLKRQARASFDLWRSS